MITEENLESLDGNEKPVDRQLEMISFLELFTKKADDKAEIAFRNKIRRESEIFELQNGLKTTIKLEREKIRRVTEEFPQPHGPKFKAFFPALGKIDNWTEEQMKSYHKPHIAPKLIRECIYQRFPSDVRLHLELKNPYIKWCLRKFKHYLFLNEEGILLLEKFIDQAVTIMKDTSTVYEFKKKYAEQYGTGFQPVLYEKYLGLIS
jgi:hypothetical protein